MAGDEEETVMVSARVPPVLSRKLESEAARKDGRNKTEIITRGIVLALAEVAAERRAKKEKQP